MPRTGALGHWITGRLEGLDLDRLIAAILADLGIDAPAVIEAAGFHDGYVLDRPLSAREALEPLARLYASTSRSPPAPCG